MAGRVRRFVVRPLVWLLTALAALLFGGYLFLGSDLARERARVLISARASEALGREVAIERVEFSLLPLSIRLDGVTIAGDRPDARRFAKLDRLEIDAEWQGGSQRVLELSHVSVSGLELDLEFREDGTDNLPRPPKGKGGKGLEVRLGGLDVENGIVRVDEQTAPVSLSAKAVDLRAVGLPGGELDAAVAAEIMELRLPEAQPIETAVAAHVRLEGSRLEIVRARLSAPELAAVASGEISLTHPATVALQAEVDTHGEFLDRLGWLHGEIAGPFHFAGDVGWRPRLWNVHGRLTSPQMQLVGFELAEVAGQVEASPKLARLALEHALYGGGTLNGRFEVGLARPFPAEVDLVASGVELDHVARQFDLPVRGLAGVASGPFHYRFDLLAARKGEGSGSFDLAAGGTVFPAASVSGRLEVRLASGELELPVLAWRSRGQAIEGSGRVALAGGSGRFDLAVDSEEVGVLVGMLPFLTPGELWVPTTGTAHAQVGLDLLPGSFRAAIEIEGGGFEAPGVRAERVAGRFTATPAAVEFASLELERPGGRLAVTGTVPVGAAGAPPLALDLTIAGWPLAEAAPWLPFELPVEGRATGTIALAGSFDALRGRAEIAIDDPVLAGVEPQRLSARFDWDPSELRLEQARAELDAGLVLASGTVALDTERLDLELHGDRLDLSRAPFSTFAGGKLGGALTLDADLGGTMSTPELALAGTFSEFTLAGEPVVADGAEGPGTPSLSARWLDGQIDARLELPGVGSLVGGGELRPGVATRLAFRLTTDRIDWLAALATGTRVAGLEGGLAADIAVELPQGAAPIVAIEIPEATFRWQGRELRSKEPVRVRLANGELRIESLYFGVAGEDDELFVAGSVRLGDDPRLDLHLQADVGAELVRPFLDDAQIGGRLSLLADLEGSVSKPELNGQGEWSAARYLPNALPHVFDRGHALVLFYPDAVVLDRLQGQFATGEIAASGRLDLAQGSVSSYRFEVAARRVALRWPPGWQTRGDADLTLVSTATGRQISGLATFDRLYYFQDIDLSPTQLIERLLARSRVIVPETDELLASTSLNVSIRAPESVRVRNNVADLTATADLALRGSLARPVLFGEVRTADGGRVTYSGNRYEIERGILTFADSTRIDPQLDIVARAKVDEYQVSLVLGGPLSRPVASFSSDPPLADLEILGLLTSGSVPSGALFSDRVAGTGGSSVGTDAVGAESILYGEAATLLGARVGKLFGFDQVRVEPLTSGDAVSSARVTVGKRLSSRLFVTYSYDSTSTAQDILQAEYRVSDRLVLVLTQNGNESFSIDARWESRF